MDTYTATALAYNNGYEQGYEQGKKDAVKHGEWQTAFRDLENKSICVECSECGAFFELDLYDFGLCYNYCPNCGSRMDGGNEDG